MFEITTDALVIDREELGEQDSRVFLYTKELGGVMARGTSMRKITSKLSAHLEPLRFARVRLLQRGRGDSGSFQIADAVTMDNCREWHKKPEALRIGLKLTRLFKEAGFRGDADRMLWEEIFNMFTAPPEEPFNKYGARFLTAIGFDPRGAACIRCGAARPKLFSINDLGFICEVCVDGHNFV